MAKRSQAWKDFERSIALEAREAGFGKAFRVCRGDDIGVSAVDVILPEVPFVKIDTKYRGNSFYHHELFFEAEKKYCNKKEDFMLLPTKGGHERSSLISLRTEVFFKLLAEKYLPKDRPLDAVGCPRCSGICRPTTIGLGLSECTCLECGIVFFMAQRDVPLGALQALNFDTQKPVDIEQHPLEILANDPVYKDIAITKAPQHKKRVKK